MFPFLHWCLWNNRKTLIDFFERNKNKSSSTSDKVQFLHHIPEKSRFQKLIEKHDVTEHMKTVVQSNVKRVFWLVLQQFQHESYTISPENKVRSHWLQCIKVRFHYAPKTNENKILQHKFWKRSENKLQEGWLCAQFHNEDHDKPLMSKKQGICSRCFRKAM